MGEFNGVILSVLLVVAIFAAVMVPMSTMFEDLTGAVTSNVEALTSEIESGFTSTT